VSTASIEQRPGESFAGLFTPERWVVNDDDSRAWSDLIYMRSLVDQIEERQHFLGVALIIPRGRAADVALLEQAISDVHKFGQHLGEELGR